MLPCPVPAHPSPRVSVSRVSVQVFTATPTGRASRLPLPLLQPLSWMPPCHLATRLTALLWVLLALPLLTKSSLVLSLPKNYHGCWTVLHWPLGPITQAMLPLPPLGPAAGTSWVLHEAKALLASLALPVAKPGWVPAMGQVPTWVYPCAPSWALQWDCLDGHRYQSFKEIPLSLC